MINSRVEFCRGGLQFVRNPRRDRRLWRVVGVVWWSMGVCLHVVLCQSCGPSMRIALADRPEAGPYNFVWYSFVGIGIPDVSLKQFHHKYPCEFSRRDRHPWRSVPPSSTIRFYNSGISTVLADRPEASPYNFCAEFLVSPTRTKPDVPMRKGRASGSVFLFLFIFALENRVPVKLCFSR